MATHHAKNAPARGELLRRLVRSARGVGGPKESSLREFARQVGVSHTVIARIESGAVRKPGRTVLGKIATHASREPAPLLYAAGHISAGELRNALKPLFADGGPLTEFTGGEEMSPSLPLEEITRRLRSRDADDAELAELAEAVFSIDQEQPGVGERLSSIAHLAAGGTEQTELLKELIDAWGYVDNDARADLVRYARSLREIADLRYQAAEAIHTLDADQGRTDD